MIDGTMIFQIIVPSWVTKKIRLPNPWGEVRGGGIHTPANGCDAMRHRGMFGRLWRRKALGTGAVAVLRDGPGRLGKDTAGVGDQGMAQAAIMEGG